LNDAEGDELFVARVGGVAPDLLAILQSIEGHTDDLARR
jgi:hypothetical protein